MAEPTDRPGKSADELLAYLVPDRECGSCVACCKILDITDPELKKPAGELCPHCTGSSCGIYEQRPQACRSWYCLWRRIEEMPDEARPDRSGVVFSFEAENPPSHPLTRFYVVGRLINGLEGLNEPGAQAALNMFIQEGSVPVCISAAGTNRLIYPRAEIAELIRSGETPPPQLKDEVEAWRERFPPI